MKKHVVCILALMTAAFVFSGCGESTKGVDLRKENLVMKLPYAAIENYTYYVEQLEGGGFKFNDKKYDLDSIIDVLGTKGYGMLKRGICLKTIGDMNKEMDVIDRFANFCVDKNIDLFIDLPYPEYVEKPENMDWIVQHADKY